MDGGEVKAVEGAALKGAHFRYYDLVMAAFVAILLLSNVLGAGKRAEIDLPLIGLWPFGAGILFFPLSYVIGDMLTEVYGYARARRCIWAGFVATLFMALMSWVVVALPPASDWPGQAAYESVFGQVPRIVFASVVAFWAGEFANSYVLARMKMLTKGRHLWSRTIGSTFVGQGIDSLIFYPLAFYGAAGWPVEDDAGGDGEPVRPQGGVGGAADSGHLRRGRLPEAARGGRRLRRRHRFHAVPGQGLNG